MCDCCRVSVWCVVWRCGVCAWAVCLLGKERRAAASCLPSPSPHCCTHSHTHSVPWLQAVEMGGGGGGGRKIKLKIKACPESPSAQRGPAGRGLQQLPLHSYQVWGWLSVCPASYWGPCLALQPWPRRPGPAPSISRSAINGARGVPGAGRDQRGPKRRTLGRKQRCRDRDVETD